MISQHLTTLQYKEGHMSNPKKAKAITICIGCLLIIAAALVIVLMAKTKRYEAVITEITDTYTSRKTVNKKRRKQYNETVNVTYVDDAGTEQQVQGVRVTRSSEASLPAVGGTIQVVKLFSSIREYNSTTPIAFAISFFFIGLVTIITGFRLGKPGSVVKTNPPKKRR